MIRFILLLCLVCTTFDNLPATRPIRTLRLQQADGSTVSVPLPEELIEDVGCPSRFSERNRSSRAFGTSSADGLGRLGFPSQGILPSLGEPLIPVVMVEFSDVAFQPTTTPERIDSLFSGENCAINRRAKGSVRDYFRAQSYGRFVPHFKVVAKVRVSKIEPITAPTVHGAKTSTSANSTVNPSHWHSSKGLTFHHLWQEAAFRSPSCSMPAPENTTPLKPAERSTLGHISQKAR